MTILIAPDILELREATRGDRSAKAALPPFFVVCIFANKIFQSEYYVGENVKMGFILIKTLKGVKINEYNQPDFDLRRKDLIDVYNFSWDDAYSMAKDMVWDYNMTDGLKLYLNIGELEYFNAENCKILKPRIEERLKKPITPRLKEMYTVLLDYISRAIEYNTGVWIEF